MTAQPLETLLLPFEEGALAWPQGPILFLNGEAAPGLPENVTIQQYFKPKALSFSPQIPQGRYEAVLILGSRQHQETQYLMGKALELLPPDGALVCAAANDAGGKRLEGDFEDCGLEAESISKHKSRVVWARAQGKAMPSWVTAGDMQPVLDGAFYSQPGIFGWNKIDTGSALLVKYLPDGVFTGAGADFGCGYGYLAAHILQRNKVDILHCLDADYRAVEACRKNLTGKYQADIDYVWADLTIPQKNLPLLEWVVMNPPFHEGKKAQYSIGTDFIKTASRTLKPGGALWMVANAHLPYETALEACFKHVKVIAEQQGFKVFHARK